MNARILSQVWFSSLPINDGDSIKIYGAIQNNSGLSFSGTATFYLDDKDISDIHFESHPDNLLAISTDWLALPGTHNFQLKIKAAIPSNRSLLSYESDVSTITIEKKIVIEIKKDTIINNISNIVSSIDEAVVPLVNKIEDLKKPVSSTSTSVVSSNSQVASVGNSNSQNKNLEQSNIDKSQSTNNKDIDIVFNASMSILAFMVKHWAWTFSSLLVLLWKIIH